MESTKFQAPQTKEIRNPNIEIRNKFKIQMLETQCEAAANPSSFFSVSPWFLPPRFGF
jgi:hypothetical protein